MSIRGGRRTDAVWQFFTKVEDPDGKVRQAKCISCDTKVSAKADRLKKHLIKCSSSSAENNIYVTDNVINIDSQENL